MNEIVLELLANNGYAVLTPEEVEEIRNSAVPTNHIVAVKWIPKQSKVIMIRGDLKTIYFPTYNFPVLDKLPDFSQLTILDFGLTLKAGDYTIDVASLVSDEI